MSKNEIERRSLSASLRSSKDDDDDSLQLTGLAAAYNSPSKDLGGFIETIAPGAFKRCLKNRDDVRALYNHDSAKVLGRVQNNTLVLNDSAEGLRFVIKLDPNNSDHRNLHASVKRGDISEVSFGFNVAPNGDRWEQRGGTARRTLLDINLLEISPVTFPAYNTTSVQARSLDYVLPSSVMDFEWEVIKAKVRAIGATILQERTDKVTDMTLRAEVERIEREARRDRARTRLQRALLGLDDED